MSRFCAVTYNEGDVKIAATILDERQAMSVVAIINQPREKRLETGGKLANALDQLRARFPGFTWMSQCLNVRVATDSGLVTEVLPPLPGRACLVAMFACGSPNDEQREMLIRRLNRFIGGSNEGIILVRFEKNPRTLDTVYLDPA